MKQSEIILKLNNLFKKVYFFRWYFCARNIRGALPMSLSTKKISNNLLKIINLIKSTLYFLRISNTQVFAVNKKYNKIFLIIFILFLSFTKTSQATTFQSPSYIIDWGNLNITSGKKTSTNFNLTDTVGQNAPGQYTSNGYQVKSGFQYIYDPNWKFVFTINNLSINFTNMTPGVGITNNNIISIASPSLGGYQIMVYENHSLQQSSTKYIQDTTCDGNSCTISNSGLWNNNSTYGFGFNIIGINNSMTPTGIGTSNYFTNENYFRPFANKSLSQNPQVIMSENRPTKKSLAKVTYKINLPVFQSTGKYENSITYIAIPKY